MVRAVRPARRFRRGSGRPGRPFEHRMAAGVAPVVAAAYDPERRRHGALARGQDRAYQQHSCFPLSRTAEQRYEGNEYRYNCIGRGEHGWAFGDIWVGRAYPVFILFLIYAQSPDNNLAIQLQKTDG